MILNSELLQKLAQLPEEEVESPFLKVADDLNDVELTTGENQQFLDATIASQIIELMHGALDTVEKYTNFKAYLTQAGREDIIPIIDELLSDAGNHVGVLEGLLKEVSPSGYEIETGERDLEKLV